MSPETFHAVRCDLCGKLGDTVYTTREARLVRASRGIRRVRVLTLTRPSPSPTTKNLWRDVCSDHAEFRLEAYRASLAAIWADRGWSVAP